MTITAFICYMIGITLGAGFGWWVRGAVNEDNEGESK